jgi:hypothetical protein
MLSCQKASALIDKKSVLGLSLIEKVQLTMHTRMCDVCSAYQKQSRFIDKAIEKHVVHQSSPNDNSPKPLSEESKDKIINKLDNL